MKKTINLLTIIMFVLILNGCGVYSFTGASISPDVKTISILQFQNNAPLVQPTLSQTLTLALRDKFASQTNLSLVKSNGDLNIDGEITNYVVQAVAVQANQQAALNRLSITIKVKFTNKKNDKQDFESIFSRYKDYNSQLDLSTVEKGLIDEINKELVEDIFNKAVVNW
ncbi:MAG: LptE family protein [Bacteroidetes bacterium]|nr:LptE family protein [Bacteroidota bacterium]